MNRVIPFREKATEIRVSACPFCASGNVRGVRAVMEGTDGQLGAFNIECIDCLGSGPQHVTLEGAAERWNKRP